MVITWYGQACFKIQSGDLVLAVDPYSRDIGLTPPRFKSDVLLVTHQHPDHNNVDSIPEGAFLIEGPGEYEVKGVTVNGIPTFHDNSQGKERGINTAYLIEMEGIRLVHLGDYGETKPRPETIEAFGEVDILFVPVGGVYTINAAEAAEVVNTIEPKIVIPMHYGIPGLKVKLEPVETFLKEMGVKNAVPEDRLTIKKKELAEDQSTRVVALKTG